MKTPKNTAKPARTTAATKPTTAKKKTSDATAAVPVVARKTTRPAAKKSTTAGAATKTPLTSPRITAAASKAKRALTEPPRTPKPTAKNPKKIAAPKSRPAAAAAGAVVATPKEAAPAPAPEPQVTLTTIEAFIDVGFGNRLTLRGEGPGLSWEKGITMNCLGSAEWVISVENAVGPLTFKFLLNDEHWSHGENYTLAPGKTGAFTPHFGG